MVPDRKRTIAEPDQQRHHRSSSWIPAQLAFINRERLMIGDSRNRGPSGTIPCSVRVRSGYEYKNTEGMSLPKSEKPCTVSRVGDPVFTVLQQGTQHDRYRACLSRLGMDDSRCETYLSNEVPCRGGSDDHPLPGGSTNRWETVLSDPLAQWDGLRTGLCGPLLQQESFQQHDCGDGTVEYFVHKIRYDTCVCVS